MDDPSWDMSDFLSRYTSKSNKQSSPLRSDDAFKGLLTFDKSPEAEIIKVTEEEFCTPENLEERLKFLNQELSMLGFNPILSNENAVVMKKDINENFDITRLVNCTYELLRRQRHQVKAKDDLEARQVRSENDNEYLAQTQIRLKQDVENLKREVALSLCREKDLVEKSKIFQQELKAEREEKRKMKADVDHLKKQFYHESKRTEKEITRLKEKVHQTLSDKSQERKIGIEILNSLQRADGKRSTWKTATKKRDEDMYKLVISNYEEKEKGLLSENLSMRDLLNDMHNMLSPDNSLNTDVSEDNTVKQYQMPFHLVKNEIEEKLKTMIANLKRKGIQTLDKTDSTLHTIEDESLTSKATTVARLQQSFQEADELLNNKIEQYKSVIKGQEKIIQSLKDGCSMDAFEKILKTFGSDEEDRVERRENLLKKQEKQFNEERKQFTDYVLKISKEKEEFEKERVEFYMTCLSTPNLKKDKALHNVHRVTNDNYSGHSKPVTPSFSPAPRNPSAQIKTPSTAELYRFMSLSYDGGGIPKSIEKSPFDGSFVQHDGEGDTERNSPSSRKLKEHVAYVRKAVEERHNKSLEEDVRKQIAGQG